MNSKLVSLTMVGTVAIGGLTLSACGGGSSTGSGGSGSAAAGAPVKGGDLTIARAAGHPSRWTRPPTFDNSSIYVFEQIMEPLFTVSPTAPRSQPLLATGYKVSEDKLTYTITLPQGREVLHRRRR